MRTSGHPFHELLAELHSGFPDAFADCAYPLKRVLDGKAPLGLSRGSSLRLAPLALEKLALRGQLRRPAVPRAEVLVTHLPGRPDYAPFLAPVAAELRARRRSVAVALPSAQAAARVEYGPTPAFALQDLADPAAYARARAAYAQLREPLLGFAARHRLSDDQRAYASIVLQAYCWQRELFATALTLTGARVVFGLHFMLDGGARGAIRARREAGAPVRTVLVQHGAISRTMPSHDFHGADLVLLWADDAAAELERFPGPLPRTLVTGNPKLERLRASQPPPHADRGAGRRVLVLGTHGDPAREERALELAARALSGAGPFEVAFRPHPAEPAARYRALIERGLLQPHQLERGPDPYAAVRAADVVVGTQSTLLVEAVALGVPAVQLLPELFELGWAERGLAAASSEAELVALVSRLATDPQAARAAVERATPLAEAVFGVVAGAAARAADAVEREGGWAPATGAGAPAGRPPLVTIMIPTYGQAHLLPRAIESALAQSYPHLEVVVADDASPDATPDTVARYAHDPRLRYVRRERNLGRTGNYRATLVEEARGDFVLNLDGDDWLRDGSYVADAMALVAQHPDLALVFARSSTYFQESDTLVDKDANVGLPPVCDGTDLFLRYPDGDVQIPHLTALYRRDLAVELGFYEHDVLSSDAVSLLLLLPGRRVGFIDRVVGAWRSHGSNATWISDPATRRANFLAADLPAQHAARCGAIEPERLRAWRRRMAARLGHRALADSLANRRFADASLILVQMVRDRPGAAVGALSRLAASGVRRLGAGART